MPAPEKPGKGNRIFISTVSNEFKTCREQLGRDLRFPEVDVQTQEQNITQLAAGQTILLKLDDYIAQCDAVIHLIGQQTSTDGSPASKAAVDDLLGRHPNLPGIVGLGEAELRTLSYTQWEAWLALYHRKTRPELRLIIATPTAAFVPDHPADTATVDAQKLSQAWHEKELQQRGRWSEITFEDPKGLSIAILRALKDILPGQQPQIGHARTRLISRHTAADFLGRDKELALLDDAWTEKQGTANLLSIIAWGGVGKTALLAYWVQSRFTDHGWQDEGQFDPAATNSAPESKVGNPKSRIPQAYFDWTFYDQGTRSDDATHAGAASVGTFFQSALKHFGDPNPESPHDKAARLARLIQAQRSLLVLDGLEPLQYPLHHPQAGQLTDPDLRELLGLLAQRNPGLVIISSRQALTDFTCGAATPTRQHDLEELPIECAVALLRQMQIIGTDEELQQAATDYACHALSLIVLGRFLFVKGRDIRLRSQIPLERANENRNQRITRNAWHVLEAYEQWLASPEAKGSEKPAFSWWRRLFFGQAKADDGKGTTAELQALRLTGLFDRPASPDCLAVLRAAPAIPGLTDQLVPLSDDAWNAVLHRLHEAHLLQLRFPPLEPGSFAPRPEAREVTVDVHPLIREYFAKHLREKQSEGFKAAHSRLFDHLCAHTEPQPATLEGLQPLYQAVVHGCLAGRQQEAREKVYRDRIKRGTAAGGNYSTKQLGAIGADLGAVAAFFEEPWSRLSANLSAAEQAWLFNEAALFLRALGRLTEAVEPMLVTLEINVASKEWENAAVVANNLSELEVTLGRVEEAVADARRSIEFADRSGDAFMRMVNRTVAADALHQSGEREEARRLFEQAEDLQRERQPQFDLLYSLGGFRYCDLILAPAERAAWRAVLGSRASVPECGGKRSATPLSSGPGTFAGSQIRDEALVTGPSEWGSFVASAKAVSPPLQGSATALQDAAAPLAALAEAERRAKQTLEWVTPQNWLLDIALDHLTLARVALYRALLEPVHPASFDLRHVTAALDGLRKAGTLHELPRALLTAALHAHLRGDAAAASRALAEAQQIAERGPMPLYLADVHLHRARLVGSLKDEGRRKKDYPGIDPKAELAKARALIEKHGYGRRLEELADAEEALR